MYGAEQVVLGLAREQIAHGRDSRIAVFVHADAQPELLRAARAQGVPALALPCRGIADARCVGALRRMLVDGRVGVLHCHDYKSIVYARLATRGLPLARIATLHGWLDGGLRMRAYRWLEMRALHGFDGVCAVSAAIEHALRDGGIRRERIHRVDNGVDLGRFRPVPRLPERATPLRIGTAARLSPEKNLGMLIDAVAECRSRGRSIELCIVGDGPLRETLAAQVHRLGLDDAVQLRGAVDKLERWYPGLDAFVLPSLTEGMPMTVLEAMACGCPVLASAVGSIPTLLAGLPHSRTLPPADLAALVDALMQQPLLDAPRQDARERVRARYSTTRMAEDYEAAYLAAVAA
jgi:glycosyltransferase involved in cell wall biosynthesis